MKKVLIIGYKGNLGQALVECYKDANPLLWDKDELDITNEPRVLEAISQAKPDLVYNCAAYNAADKAESEIEIANLINGTAVGYLAKACKANNSVLVHFSSNYVFDGANQAGYAEDFQPNPQSAYAKSKRLGEEELIKNTDKYYLVRTAMLYGSRTAIGKKSFVDIMIELAGTNKPINCVADEWGQPTNVKDLAQALVSLTEQELPFGIYHLTNSGQASWYDWAKEIFRIKNLSPELNAIKSEELKRPAKRPKFGILNNTKYIQLRPWDESLEEYLT